LSELSAKMAYLAFQHSDAKDKRWKSHDGRTVTIIAQWKKEVMFEGVFIFGV